MQGEVVGISRVTNQSVGDTGGGGLSPWRRRVGDVHGVVHCLLAEEAVAVVQPHNVAPALQRWYIQTTKHD